MTLGCGIYGSPLKTEKMEKEWPVNRTRAQFEIGRITEEEKDIQLFAMWLRSGKFYGAEYMDETDN